MSISFCSPSSCLFDFISRICYSLVAWVPYFFFFSYYSFKFVWQLCQTKYLMCYCSTEWESIKFCLTLSTNLLVNSAIPGVAGTISWCLQFCVGINFISWFAVFLSLKLEISWSLSNVIHSWVLCQFEFYFSCNCLFPSYILQIWRKFQNVGEDMVLLASSLSNMSQDQKLVRMTGHLFLFTVYL